MTSQLCYFYHKSPNEVLSWTIPQYIEMLKALKKLLDDDPRGFNG